MRRRLAVWLIGSTLLAAVTVLVGCSVSTSVTPVAAAKHVAFPAGTACDASGCHTPQSFKPAYLHKQPYLGACDTCHNLTSWKTIAYKHKDATFDNGMHPLIGCAMCHTEGQPLPTGGCATCHDSPHGGWTSCSSCHTTLAWRLFKPLPTGHLSLAGGHSKLVCLDCHKTAKAPATPRRCVSCHGTNHGGLTNCETCHSPATGWKPKPGWNHDSFFKLVGFHKTLDCTQCHKNGNFAGTPKACVGCHGTNHGGVTDCQTCHTPVKGWTPKPGWPHDTFFKLVGAHRKLDCTQCHKNGTFPGTPRVCVGCHGKQHGGLTDCASCHNTTAFKPSTFRHSSVFPLTGLHTKLACTRCHPGGQFARTIGTGGHACVACHTAPASHGGLTNCAECHNTSGFQNTTFNHNVVFPLTGRHVGVPCTSCHTSVFQGTPRTCAGCHAVGTPALSRKTPHAGTAPSTCQTCHTTAGFEATYVIKPYTDHPIPLTATHHVTGSCKECHNATPTVFSPPTQACFACHRPGGPGRSAPHVGPTDCERCHYPTTFAQAATFAHPVIQNFTNTGPAGHQYTDFGAYPAGCLNCHPGTGGNPNFTSFNCTIAGCHV